jgi:pantoate--beta-alanine ligase
MQVIKSVSKLQEIRKNIQGNIGFVPTMGNLHLGHVSLIKQSLQENEVTIISIFINQTQFDKKDDFINYPVTIKDDIALLENLGVNYLFMPEYQEIYPDDYQFQIANYSQYSHVMEGKFRKNHFVGMLTIVMKLLLLIKANRAYFGEKDFQQLQLIKEMVGAFFIDTQIIACETIKDKNGLALSSRNNRLTEMQLNQAAIFPNLLRSDKNNEEVMEELKKSGFMVDYVEIYDNRRFGAVKIGNVRLIDNVSYNK